MTSRPAPARRERRRNARFDWRIRVQHGRRRQWASGGVLNISTGGMLLAGANDIRQGAATDFLIHLLDDPAPLAVRGTVRSLSDGGTHVAFAPGQDEAKLRVRRVIEEQVVPSLEHRLGRPGDDTSVIRQLAQWHRERGKTGEGLRLYRGAVDVGQHPANFFADMATFLLDYAELGSAADPATLDEVQRVLNLGRELGPSLALEALGRRATALRQSFAVTVPVAADEPPPEIVELRRSIEGQRNTLYAGFAQLLGERHRLRQLEDRAALSPAGPVTHSAATGAAWTATLDTIRTQLAQLAPASPRPDDQAAPPATGSELRPPGRRRSPPPHSAAAPARRPIGKVRLLVTTVTAIAATTAAVWLMARPLDGSAPAAQLAASVTTSIAAVVAPEPPLAAVPLEPPKPAPVPPLPAPVVAVAEAPAAAPPVTEDPLLANAPPPAIPVAVLADAGGGRARAEPAPRPSPARGAAASARSQAAQEFDRAVELLRQRKVLLAIDALDRCVALAPNNAEAFRLLGVSNSLVGRESAAIAALDRFVALAPEHKHAAQAQLLVDEYRQRRRR